MSTTRLLVLSVLLMVIASCPAGSAVPRLNNAMLWKRLGLNRAIGEDRPQITSSKKKGESTVYYIKLPPQPHYYIPLNILTSAGGYQKSTPDPFETVSVDFTANGKPENVYHWNLPLSITVPSTTTMAPTTTDLSTTTAVSPESTTHLPLNNKKPYRHNYYNNGKPHKLYFVKPFYGAPSTPKTTSLPSIGTPATESPTVTPPTFIVQQHKKLQFKKNFYSNGKPNQVFFVQQAANYHS